MIKETVGENGKAVLNNMSLMEEIKQINNTESIKPLSSGKAESVKEFWDQMVQPNLPAKEIVEQWTEMLLKYVDDEDAVFAIRKGNTRKNNDAKTLRRCFYNTISGSNLSFYYDDNDLAAYIMKMAMDGFVPDLEEFKQALKDHEFPMHFNALCSEEKRKAVGRLTAGNPGFGKNGYKVSHVIDSGDNYYFKGECWNISKICQNYFPLGNYDEWEIRDGVYVREFSIRDKEDSLKLLKAHFLRYVCPINYMLTPKTRSPRCQYSSIKIRKNDIGESKELQQYAMEQLRGIHGSLYTEYLSMVMLPSLTESGVEDLGSTVINLTYGFPNEATVLREDGFKKGKETIHEAKRRDSKVEFSFNPSDEETFKRELLRTKRAKKHLIYADGRVETKIWTATSFKETSSLRGNIQSSVEVRKAPETGLKRIELEIMEDQK